MRLLPSILPVFALLLSGACTTNYRPGPEGSIRSASIVPVHPDRPRVEYRAPSIVTRLHVRSIQLKLLDARKLARTDAPGAPVLAEPTGEHAVPVSAHRDLQSWLDKRLEGLADGAPDAPALVLLVQVEQADAFRGAELRRLTVQLLFGLQTEQGTPLASMTTSATGQIDTPYDLAELDHLHLATFLKTFDLAFQPSSIEKLNALLLESQGAPAQTSDQT